MQLMRPVSNSTLKQAKRQFALIQQSCIIDLHGMTSIEAMSVIEPFVRNVYFSGQRFVKIITGKGKGILREMTLNCISYHINDIILIWQLSSCQGAYNIMLEKLINNTQIF